MVISRQLKRVTKIALAFPIGVKRGEEDSGIIIKNIQRLIRFGIPNYYFGRRYGVSLDSSSWLEYSFDHSWYNCNISGHNTLDRSESYPYKVASSFNDLRHGRRHIYNLWQPLSLIALIIVYFWGLYYIRERYRLRKGDRDINRARREVTTEAGGRSFLCIAGAAISGASWIVTAGAAISSFQCRGTR